MSGSAILIRLLALGLIAAGLMALSILLRDEIWNGRTTALVAIWFGGGCAGGGLSLVALHVARARGWHRPFGALRGPLFLVAFLIGGALSFLLATRIIAGTFPMGLRWFVMWATFGSAEIMALFFYSASRYLLPWMAPALIAAGYLLLPASPGDPAVEPQGPDV